MPYIFIKNGAIGYDKPLADKVVYSNKIAVAANVPKEEVNLRDCKALKDGKLTYAEELDTMGFFAAIATNNGFFMYCYDDGDDEEALDDTFNQLLSSEAKPKEIYIVRRQELDVDQKTTYALFIKYLSAALGEKQSLLCANIIEIDKPFEIAVCYKDDQGRIITMVGQSGPNQQLVSALDACVSEDAETITSCAISMQQLAMRMQPAPYTADPDAQDEEALINGGSCSCSLL